VTAEHEPMTVEKTNSGRYLERRLEVTVVPRDGAAPPA